MITINRTGYSRQADRLNNLHNEVKYEISPKNRIYELLTPIPIDINYEVSIISKNQSDIDQIATNFMVFFNSDVYVTCQHPKYLGIKLNNQVIMQDSVSEEHPDELDPTTDDLITSVFQFTFKTYLFGGTEQLSGGEFIPAVRNIYSAWYAIPDAVTDYDEYIEDVEHRPEPERFRDYIVWKIDEMLSVDA